MARSGPTEQELVAARDRTIADVVAPGLRVLFCGINPGLWSAARDQHFARPGNRFWPALQGSGFTPEVLGPARQWELLDFGLGITNLVPRATARADELAAEEYRLGAKVLDRKVRRLHPAWLAVVGIGAYRTAFGRPKAVIGPQDHRIGDTAVWVLPNPSGLNAHYGAAALAGEFARLRAAAEAAHAGLAAAEAARAGLGIEAERAGRGAVAGATVNPSAASAAGRSGRRSATAAASRPRGR